MAMTTKGALEEEDPFDELFSKIESEQLRSTDDLDAEEELTRGRRAERAQGGSSRSRSRSTGNIDTRAKSQSRGGRKDRDRSKSRGRDTGGSTNSEADNTRQMSDDFDSSQGEKRKKTKLEKIEQLQAKNALYKEEFKRVQKDRKHLKKEIEGLKSEIESLNKQIDSHVAETTLLKSQLSEALQKGGDHSEKIKQSSEAEKRMGEILKKTTAELDLATTKMSELTKVVESLQNEVKVKDAQLVELNGQLFEIQGRLQAAESNQQEEYEAEIRAMQQRIGGLEGEQVRLQAELEETVDRASSMVKEREEAIAELLKENEDIKNLLQLQEAQNGDGGEQTAQLEEELAAANGALEETQDRNVILEEEVEGWVAKGEEMNKEIARLQDDLDMMEQRASKAEQGLTSAEARAERAAASAAEAQEALKQGEAQFEAAMAEASTRHKEALLEAKTRYANSAQQKGSGPETIDQQAMLLKKVVAKKTDRAGKWFSSFLEAGSVEMDSGEEAKNKRIQLLEEKNAAQQEELKTVRSELVRVRTTMNEALYHSKKQMDRMDHENDTYAKRVAELESEIARLKGN